MTPYTPDEFAAVWRKSEDRARLLQEIEEFDLLYPLRGPSLDAFKQSRKALQARSQSGEIFISTFTYTDSELGAYNRPTLFQFRCRSSCVSNEVTKGSEEIWPSSLLALSST